MTSIENEPQMNKKIILRLIPAIIFIITGKKLQIIWTKNPCFDFISDWSYAIFLIFYLSEINL